MGLGYALTEDYPLKDSVPQAKYGTLGLMRSTQIPDIHANLCGEGRTATICIRGKRNRRDCDDPDSTGGSGCLLCDGSYFKIGSSDERYLLFKQKRVKRKPGMDNVEYGIQETEAKKGKNPARVSALAGFFLFLL